MEEPQPGCLPRRALPLCSAPSRHPVPGSWRLPVPPPPPRDPSEAASPGRRFPHARGPGPSLRLGPHWPPTSVRARQADAGGCRTCPRTSRPTRPEATAGFSSRGQSRRRGRRQRPRSGRPFLAVLPTSRVESGRKRGVGVVVAARCRDEGRAAKVRVLKASASFSRNVGTFLFLDFYTLMYKFPRNSFFNLQCFAAIIPHDCVLLALSLKFS